MFTEKYGTHQCMLAVRENVMRVHHAKKEIEELQRQCDKEDDRAFYKEQFLKAVRKFMEMKTLTPTILHELVERIDVYQTQGTGKNRTQRIVIHYNFIGVLDLPEVEEYPDNVVLDSRQG